MANEEFDLCIIGAGASGAGVALDAASRGLKVALIDKNDFCAETSSRSTKLIHGGVRYLEQAFKKLDLAQLKQVKHGLHERRTLLKNAPHLAKPLALITPVFSWWEGLYYFIGLKMYNHFARHDGLPKPAWLSKRNTLERIPGIAANIHSSVLYYDGTFNDSRFCLAMVQKAGEYGTAMANYVELVDFNKNEKGKIVSARCTDLFGHTEFEIKAKQFLNCTGPYADHVRLMAEQSEELRMRPAKGVHISFSTEFVKSQDALLIPETKDGRVVFVKPLKNEVIAGTTDTAYHNLEEEPVLEEEEVEYLLETLEPFLQEIPKKTEIKAGFAGIRPLLAPKRANRKETKSLLRDHEVEYLERAGLLSLLGGKWTTYRVMAQDAVDRVCELLGKQETCQTADILLYGGDNLKGAEIEVNLLGEEWGISEDTRAHLVETYGGMAPQVLKLCAEKEEWKTKILGEYPYLMGEVVYAIRFEMVMKFRDFLSRRVRLEILNWERAEKAMERIAPIFQKELNWTEEERLEAQTEYKALLEHFINSAHIVENKNEIA